MMRTLYELTGQDNRRFSPTALLDESDPVYAWRGRMGELFDGYAKTTTMHPL